MGTEISTETADTDEIDDPTFEPSSANQKDEPAPDQLPDDETPPRSEEDETDPPDATGPPSAFRAAI